MTERPATEPWEPGLGLVWALCVVILGAGLLIIFVDPPSGDDRVCGLSTFGHGYDCVMVSSK